MNKQYLSVLINKSAEEMLSEHFARWKSHTLTYIQCGSKKGGNKEEKEAK